MQAFFLQTVTFQNKTYASERNQIFEIVEVCEMSTTRGCFGIALKMKVS